MGVELPKHLIDRYKGYQFVLEQPKYSSAVKDNLSRLLEEAFGRLGLDLKLQEYPTARGAKLAEAGVVDGSALRDQGFIAQRPSLILIPKVLLSDVIHIYYIDKNGKEFQLNGKKVVVTRGAFIMKRAAAKAAQIIVTNTSAQALAMVARGRADATVFFRQLPESLEALYIRSGIIKRSSAPVLKSLGYAALHKKHEDLAVYLTQVFEEMGEEGLINLAQRHYERASR